MRNEDLWEHVRLVTEWLDKHSDPNPNAYLLRIMKVSEEVGEVTAAVIGATGQNPRKGRTHTWFDVETELYDVALAAMVAAQSLAGDSSAKGFADHVKQRHARLLAMEEK